MKNFEQTPNFGGKNLTPEDEEMIREGFAQIRERGRKPFEGELEKNETELRFIQLMNGYLNEELRELDIKKEVGIAPEQVHILSHEGFTKYVQEKIDEEPEPDLGGLYSSTAEAIIIDKTSGTPLQLLRAIFHEAVHFTSWHRWSFDIPELKGQERTGYSIIHSEKRVATQEKLRGFNEAVTETITREALSRHKDEIVRLLNLSEKDQKVSIFSYNQEREILDTVIGGIAKKKGEKAEAVWQEIKKGYFTGEIMHLRDIERSFGKGSLEVLALLHASPKGFGPQETREKILAYFQADNKKERKKLYTKLVKGIS